jgi:hypothetical protein
MKVRDLYAARPLESQQQPSPDYRGLYHQTAEALSKDCWAIDSAWLFDHPEHWEQIRDLDDRLTTMERLGASELEYRTTLEQMVECIQDAWALYERECKEAGESAVQ